MNEQLILAEKLRNNVEQLLRRYTALKNETSILKNQLDALRAGLSDKNTTIALMQQELTVIKTAQALGGNTEEHNSELKQKINAYIKEIDKCIALLNHEF